MLSFVCLIFIEISCCWSYWQYVSCALDNGFAANRQQSMIWPISLTGICVSKPQWVNWFVPGKVTNFINIIFIYVLRDWCRRAFLQNVLKYIPFWVGLLKIRRVSSSNNVIPSHFDVNIVSSYGLVLSGIKPLPEPMLTKIDTMAADDLATLDGVLLCD